MKVLRTFIRSSIVLRRLSFQSPEGIQPLCAEVWHREESLPTNYRREQLQVVGIQPQPEDDNDDRVVYHAADDRKGQRTEEVQMLAEYRAGNNLADYDGGKPMTIAPRPMLTSAKP